MLGIYCRTSRETEIENSTISQQRTAGIKFAEQHNFEYDICYLARTEQLAAADPITTVPHPQTLQSLVL